MPTGKLRRPVGCGVPEPAETAGMRRLLTLMDDPKNEASGNNPCWCVAPPSKDSKHVVPGQEIEAVQSFRLAPQSPSVLQPPRVDDYPTYQLGQRPEAHSP